MKTRIKCNSENCEEFATHGVHWTEGELKVCLECAQKIVGVGNVMGFGVPSSTFRQLSLEELFQHDDIEEAAQALVDFFTERGIPTTAKEAIEGTRKWVTLFERWDDPAQSLKEYHTLWTTLATAIVKEQEG